MNTEILQRFQEWLEAARAHPEISEPEAMCLATATKQGAPSARMVLLKSFDARGFVFFTNSISQKGMELQENPQAALCFYWMPLDRQIRVQGSAEKVGEAEADAYFLTRPRGSQIAAWVSHQSQPLESLEKLATEMAAREREFADKPIPRPPFWIGWRVVPSVIEFWQERPHRLHHRERYTRQEDGSWLKEWLYP